METQGHYLKVGSFVLIFLIGLVAATLWFNNFTLRSNTLPYYIYFNGAVTGLQVGSTVKYQGVPVGSATAITIDPDNPNLVRVLIELNQTAPIHADTVARLELQGITGTSFIQLSGGSLNTPIIQTSWSHIATIPSQSSPFQAFMDEIPKLVSRLIEFTEDADQFLDPQNVETYRKILQNIEVFTDNLSRSSNAFDKVIAQTEKTMSDVSLFTKNFDRDFNRVSQSVTRTSNSIGNVIEDNRESLDNFASTGLDEFVALATELRELAVNISRLVDRVDRDPGEFLFGGTRNGVKLPLSSGDKKEDP